MSQQQQQQPVVNVLLDTVQQVKEGQLPSNVQATSLLDQTSQFLQQKQMQADSKTAAVLSDVQELAQAAKQFIETKNPNDNVQTLVSETLLAGQEAVEQLKPESEKLSNAVDTDKAQDSLQKMGQSVLQMSKLILRSGEFRTYLLELTNLFHEILVRNIEGPTDQTVLGTTQQPTTPLFTGQTTGFGVATTGLDTTPLSNTFTNLSLTSGLGTTTPATFGATNNWGFSDKKKHELGYRFISLLRRVNNHPQFKEGMQNFRDLLNDIIEQAKSINITEHVQNNEHLQKAQQEAKNIIQQFSGKSTDTLLNAISSFQESLRNEPNMTTFLTDLKDLLTQVFTTPELVDEYSFVIRVEDLVTRGRKLTEDTNWRKHYEKIFTESNSIWESIKADKDLSTISEKAQRLIQDFTYMDNTGHRVFNQDLLGQMRQYIIPLFVELLNKVPIPAVTGYNEDYDYIFENLVLSGYDIVPEHIAIHTTSDTQVDVKNLEARTVSKAIMKIENIQVKMEDVNFWFNRKAFPRIEDRGVIDVSIEGEGMNIVIKFELDFQQGTPFLISDMNIDIDALIITIKKSQHEFLLNIWTTLYKGSIKESIAKTVENRIRSIFKTIETGFSDLLHKYPPKTLLDVTQQQLLGK